MLSYITRMMIGLSLLTLPFGAAFAVDAKLHHAIITNHNNNDGQYSTYSLDYVNPALKVIDVHTMRGAIGSLSVHGLSPKLYRAEFDRIDPTNRDAIQRFMLKVLYDLRFGMTREPEGEGRYQEASLELLNSMAQCNDLALCFQHVAARHPQYVPLQIVLDDYRTIAKRGGWQAVAAGRVLKLGVTDARVTALRHRLTQSADYTAKQDDGLHYDEALEKAVRHFQARHGLNVDGVVGPATLNALNVPIERRIEQIKLTLERLRRLPKMHSPRYVHVNIPSYQLTAYHGDQQALKMDVIVGKRGRQTPEFFNKITTVGINPSWTPTSRIVRQDLLPKFRNDPDYANRGGYRITDRYSGQALDPWRINWDYITAQDIRVTQRPGRANALGKVKFMLPDNKAIYLHDTAKPYLFSQSMRALSSGCVRLKDPKAFLQYVIDAQPTAGFARLKEHYQKSERKYVRLDQPIPVKATYFTAWINASGVVEFYDDIYGKDDRLQLAMQRYSRQYAAR